MLTTGTYWLNVQANLNFDEHGLFYWMDRGVQSGNPAQWRNPDDGWESGCTDWTPKTQCDQGEGVDMLFQIRGSINTPTAPPTPRETHAVPTLNASGMLIGGGGLALLALLGLRRRSRQ